MIVVAATAMASVVTKGASRIDETPNERTIAFGLMAASLPETIEK